MHFCTCLVLTNFLSSWWKHPVDTMALLWGRYFYHYIYREACAIEMTYSVILIGGDGSPKRVHEYNFHGFVAKLPDLNTGRRNHACGHYVHHTRLWVLEIEKIHCNIHHIKPKYLKHFECRCTLSVEEGLGGLPVCPRPRPGPEAPLHGPRQLTSPLADMACEASPLVDSFL